MAARKRAVLCSGCHHELHHSTPYERRLIESARTMDLRVTEIVAIGAGRKRLHAIAWLRCALPPCCGTLVRSAP